MLSPKGTAMKTFFCSLLLSAALAGTAAAQTNLAGTWQGRLEAAPGKTLTIHFVIAAKPGGGYSAVVTSPDSGAIKNVQAASVTFANSKLTLDVPALSGSYAGTLHDGVLEGEWSQEGKKLPLSLKPYKTPTLTRADIDALRGEWVGKLKPPGNEVAVVFHFNPGGEGVLNAVMDLPERHVKGVPAADVALDDGHFSLQVPGARIEVQGELKGDQIIGEWTDPSISTSLALKKGRYVEPAPTYLDLPAEARAHLKGRWSGTLNGLAVIVSFETDAQGRTLGIFDSMQQHMSFPINEASLAGTKLTFDVSYGAKFTGEIAGSKLTGEWTQPGLPKPLPLVLAREK